MYSSKLYQYLQPILDSPTKGLAPPLTEIYGNHSPLPHLETNSSHSLKMLRTGLLILFEVRVYSIFEQIKTRYQGHERLARKEGTTEQLPWLKMARNFSKM